MARTLEEDLVCPVLNILVAHGGTMTTTALKAEVRKLSFLTAADLAPSPTRTDKLIDQITGNIVCHRFDEGNMVYEGLLDYAKGYPSGSLSITPAGAAYLAKHCP